jgi:hypothetical protein
MNKTGRGLASFAIRVDLRFLLMVTSNALWCHRGLLGEFGALLRCKSEFLADREKLPGQRGTICTVVTIQESLVAARHHEIGNIHYS